MSLDVPRLVRTHISTSELNPPRELIDGVNNGQIPLLDVVKALGEYLTSVEDSVRLKGLTFLTNLLAAINSAKINRQATQTLTSFYISKLDDFDSLPPALQGLTTLSKLPAFDDAAAVDVYQAVVENVNMKSYAQATRHLVYVLFDSLVASHRNALRGLGAAFLNSYTKMVDGEKDPRNLMLLFSIDRVILLEFDVKDHIEDFFDITFCYFPITFKPPPNDPYGITADDLKLALRGCMAATPYFAKMALPLFLEKFATATGQSMRDLMLSMAACFPVYGSEAVGERGAELWEGIKTEILYSSDTSIEAAALSALEGMIRTMYPNLDDAPIGLAQDIIKQCLELLEEPEKSQALSATKILAAMLRASASAGRFAYSQAFPQLFRQFNQPKSSSHRAPILSTISSLLTAAQSIYAGYPSSDSSVSQRAQSTEKSLDPYRESLIDVLREGLRTGGLKAPAVKGCVALIEIPGFCDRREVEDIVRGMDEILIHDEDPEIRPEVISGLTSISNVHPTTIESITLPLLFHNLPEHAPAVSAITEREKYRSILSSLSELCVQPALFETLVIRITTKLDLLSSSPINAVSNTGGDGDVSMGTDREESRECNIAYAFNLLTTLTKVIDKKLSEKHTDLLRHVDTLIPRLYTLVVEAATPRIGDSEPLFRDRRLLAVIAKVAETMMWELNAERQSKHFELVYAAFEQDKLAGIVHDPTKVGQPSSSPLRNNASAPEQDLICIYSSAIQGLKPDTKLPFTSSPEFLSSKIHWTINVARDMFQVKWALDMITAFVNKRETDLRVALETILERIWEVEIQDTSKDPAARKRGLLVYLHVVKALALLRQPLAYTAIERVIDILTLSNLDPEFVGEAARGFGVLTKGKEKGSHLTAKLLHAQKLWNFVLPKLIEGDRESSGKGRLVYLVAFASLLPLVPASLCLSELSTILPLLLRSLSLPDPAQRTNAITTLTSILETANSSKDVDIQIHQQAAVLVDALLRSAVLQQDVPSSSKVRTAALVALSAFPDVVRFETLHADKSRVLKELGKTLDDPLRAVRKEAVECRAKWYRYGGST